MKVIDQNKLLNLAKQEMKANYFKKEDSYDKELSYIVEEIKDDIKGDDDVIT